MGKVELNQAVKLLKSGIPVALPTETVYGLACPIDQPEALKKVFSIKKRPLNDPLIVHASNVDMALSLFQNPSETLIKLAKHFWPGPLTLVYKKNENLVSDLITSNLNSVAVRIPQSDLFKEVINKVNTPLAAPSANIFKQVSPTSAEHVLKTLPEVDVLDGGNSDVGIESTILDVNSLTILRPGQITHEDIEKLLGLPVMYKEQSHVPGSESDHYQPKTPVYVFNSQNSLDRFMTTETKSVELKLNNDVKASSSRYYGELRKLDGQASHICLYYNPANSSADWFGLKNRILKSSTKWMD